MALDRLGLPLYVELALRGDNRPDGGRAAKKSLCQWIQMRQGRDRVLDSAIPIINSSKVEVQPVFIAADLGHEHGYMVREISSRLEHMKALIVAFIGYQNPIMCSCCIRSYTSNFSVSREHILTPFHACRSVPGFMGGQCANCIWHSRSDCEWLSLRGYQPTTARNGQPSDHLKGSSRLECATSYAVSVLNHVSCPRVVEMEDLDSYIKGDSKLAAEVKTREDWDEELGFSRF